MGNKLCDLNTLMTRDCIQTMYNRYKAFFGYGEGVPYARVCALFGETAAKEGMSLATVRIIPAVQPDEEDVHFIFYPANAFLAAAARANIDAELRRVRDTEEEEMNE